jgi:hypothetical protein
MVSNNLLNWQRAMVNLTTIAETHKDTRNDRTKFWRKQIVDYAGVFTPLALESHT